MASTNEPTDESINLFCDLTGLLRAEAITRLKANNNDIQRACEEYFEDPDSVKYKWDESQFSMDRHGDNFNDTGISFNIQGPDELGPGGYQNNAAPTRPPSRANNPSPFGAPANAAEEDANLERALAESAAESGIQLQEAGIVDNETNLKYFGPANRPQYETEQWAMVPTKTTLETVKADPTPSARKRDANIPAFLRSKGDHRVGAILSIYHKIPLFRNILLQCGVPTKNYGHNSEWWRGQAILKHEHLAAMAKGESIWGEDAHPEFAEELHRLIAFLDKTERSYGSVDGLVDTKAIDPSFGAWIPDVEEKLYEALQEESLNNPDCDMSPVTTVGTVMFCAQASGDEAQSEGDADSSSDEDRDTRFVFLDLMLDYEQYPWVNTFYDALDNLLWTHALSLDHNFPDEANFAVLAKPAEVITVRFGGTGLVKPCEIPAVFYVDRYMKDRKDLALKFQTYIRFIKKKLRLYDLLGANLIRCRGQRCHRVNGLSNGPHDLVTCLDGIIKQTERLIERQTRTAQWRYHYERMERDIELTLDDIFDIHTWNGPRSFLPEEEERLEKWKEVISGCKEQIDELRTDLANLTEAKEAYWDSMRIVAKRLTCQEDEVDDSFIFRSTPAYHPEYWNPTMKYSLRGVGLTSELAYVCVRQDAGSMDVDGVSESKDQWWKIGYSANDASPIKTEKANVEDVLHAAGTESKNPILIYATEAAMEAEPIPLSDALRMFVRADNRSFQQELSQEQDQEQQQQQQQQPYNVHSGVTVEDISAFTNHTRKHSVASSVATRGSSRDALSEVDLTFDEPGTFQPSVPYHASKQLSAEYNITEEMQTFSTDVSTSKSPEMQEVASGSTPFLSRPSRASQNDPIDMMDVDFEHHEG
ncbi:uncharacterized protein F4822DRAFT_171209 [Hypoxylon trugodes]|uniref:uncharacterized protein n=1 Tax=Hypoxylon trugodes TaxID=326681 RepID=UPI002190FE29|nr:uncharacterized protein F4822DRAFT_171209 [Hypoxylon trugodes]KAI1391065.1 hypothetical protein F4822DRAFT_171209 [Hypoxylon trugodes]